MTEVIVRTQQELDAALNEPANHAIMIASEENMLLNVSSTVGKIVSARSGRLCVCGNARVESVSDDAMRDGVDDDQVVSALVTASENVDSAIHDTKHAFAIYLRRVEA